jgi:hypothetical protein
MEGFLKNRPVFLLLIISLFLLVANIASCFNLYSQSSYRRKEMAGRLEAEEKVAKLFIDKASLAGKLKEIERELEQERASLEAVKKDLLQEQLVCQSLKEDLQKAVKLKEGLEGELKKTLKANK